MHNAASIQCIHSLPQAYLDNREIPTVCTADQYFTAVHAPAPPVCDLLPPAADLPAAVHTPAVEGMGSMSGVQPERHSTSP